MKTVRILPPVVLLAVIFAADLAKAAEFVFDQVVNANVVRIMDGVTGLSGCFY